MSTDLELLDDRDRLAVRYRGVAKRVASRYVRVLPGLDFDDLESAAWVGVLKAARTYDPVRGPLAHHLFRAAARSAARCARRALRFGIRGASPEVRFTNCGPDLLSLIAAPADRTDLLWGEDDWAAALADLRPSDRELVLAVYREGVPQTELAGRFGPTRAAVNVRLGGLRARLRASDSLIKVALATEGIPCPNT